MPLSLFPGRMPEERHLIIAAPPLLGPPRAGPDATPWPLAPISRPGRVPQATVTRGEATYLSNAR